MVCCRLAKGMDLQYLCEALHSAAMGMQGPDKADELNALKAWVWQFGLQLIDYLSKVSSPCRVNTVQAYLLLHCAGLLVAALCRLTCCCMQRPRIETFTFSCFCCNLLLHQIFQWGSLSLSQSSVCAVMLPAGSSKRAHLAYTHVPCASDQCRSCVLSCRSCTSCTRQAGCTETSSP